jgi:hypothetical protein
MPLELVRDIDDAFTTLTKWKIDNLRQTRAKRKSAGRNEERPEDPMDEWTPYPTREDLRIRGLCLSPSCLALLVRLLDMGALNKASLLGRVFILLVMAGLARFAQPMMPFQKTYGLKYLGLLLPIVSLSISYLYISLGIYVDAAAAPIVGHVLRDVSDREELHFIVIGTTLAVFFDIMSFVLAKFESLFWTFAAFLLVVLVLQLVGWYICMEYWMYYPVDMVTMHSHPPYWISFVRFTNQRFMFNVNKNASRLLSVYIKTADLSPPLALGMDDQTPDIYRTLPLWHIRLLRILPGRPLDPIQCQFVSRHILFAGPYEAVSYVWGTSPKKVQILVNSKTFSVTTSAYRIIRDRRSRLHEKMIWIDQICINQKNDLKEKEHQIRMMKSIYSRAQLVTAWLGPSQDAQIVQDVAATLHFLREGHGWSGERIKANILARYDKAEWVAMTRFFRNAWFHRTWILQEAAAAKRLHLMYGNICMDWAYVARAVMVLYDYGLTDLLTVPVDDDPYPSDQVNVIKRRSANVGVGNADTIMSLRGDVDFEIPFTLAQLLEHCKFFDSSKEQDKVFSLLGLATDDSRDVLRPNYTASIGSVYIETMTYLLKTKSDPLYALSDAGISHTRVVKGLPSWVPDWSIVSLPPPAARRYDAGKRKPASIRFDQDPSIIELDGVKVDSIESEANLSSVYSPEFHGDGLQPIVPLHQWFAEIEQLAHRAADTINMPDSSLPEAVFRTILWDNLDVGAADEHSPSSAAALCALRPIRDPSNLLHPCSADDALVNRRRLGRPDDWAGRAGSRVGRGGRGVGADAGVSPDHPLAGAHCPRAQVLRDEGRADGDCAGGVQSGRFGGCHCGCETAVSVA